MVAIALTSSLEFVKLSIAVFPLFRLKMSIRRGRRPNRKAEKDSANTLSLYIWRLGEGYEENLDRNTGHIVVTEPLL